MKLATVNENAKKLVKAMYDDWIKDPNIYSRDGLAENFGSLFEGKEFVITRQYAVEKGWISELPGSQQPRFRIHAKGIDLIEQG